MYPILETKRLILNPLQESDFDDMFKLASNPIVIATMEGEVQGDPNAYKKELMKDVKRGEYLIIRLKETDGFIGFIAIHQYMNKRKHVIDYSQIWTALLPEYWGHGFCTEASNKLLHFAFLGIKTPLIYANQFCTNPAAGRVLKKCGFSYYRTLKMENEPYDQYRYFKEDYIMNNDIDIADAINIYDYTFLYLQKSPYNYDNPIRKIEGIKYVKEPTGYLCGQSCIAMLADVSVDEVIDVMETDKGTSVAAIDEALTYYGFKHAKTRKRFKADTILPDICILSLQLPGYGHWSLYYKGTFYDPEFGVLRECPTNASLDYYWEIYDQTPIP